MSREARKKIKVETLVAAVKARPPLWQDDHVNYKNRKLANELWNEVADICNATVINVKIKWKNLKDNFRRETKKMPSESDHHIWRHYNKLLFLKQYIGFNSVKYEQTECKYEQIDCESILEESLEEKYYSDSNSVSPPSDRGDDERFYPEVQMPSSSSCYDNPNSREMECFSENNPDLLFFKSLLPHMQDFTTIEKLEIKAEIVQMILRKQTNKI